MDKGLSFGLRLASGISAAAGTAYGLGAMLAPKLMADLAGLPGVDLAVYQQAGAFSLSAGIVSFLILRAANWDQARIAATGIFVNVFLSALGAFYYVVLQGVVSLALVGILVYTTYASVAFGYYLWFFPRGVRRDVPEARGVH